jgi:hypothetical protein
MNSYVYSPSIRERLLGAPTRRSIVKDPATVEESPFYIAKIRRFSRSELEAMMRVAPSKSFWHQRKGPGFIYEFDGMPIGDSELSVNANELDWVRFYPTNLVAPNGIRGSRIGVLAHALTVEALTEDFSTFSIAHRQDLSGRKSQMKKMGVNPGLAYPFLEYAAKSLSHAQTQGFKLPHLQQWIEKRS